MDSWVSIYWLAPLAGWFTAHVIKFGLEVVRSGGKNASIAIFFESGGMPSSHSAVIVATLVVIGVEQGINSPVFGLAATIASIVIFDALNVRRSVGEQGEVLKRIAKDLKVKQGFTLSRGHTPLEVVAGSVVGAAVALVLLQIL